MHGAMRRVALALLVLSWAGPAVAQSSAPGAEIAGESAEAPTRIVLVMGPGLEELARRFTAELSSLRFEVVRASTPGDTSAQAALEALATEQRARAAVRVAAAEGGIDLWLVNPRTHEALYRRIVSERDPAIAVLRSLEILRGSLVDLQALAPREPVGTPPAQPEKMPEKSRPAPERRYSLWLGGSLVATSRDSRSTPAWGAQAGLHFAVAPKFWLHAEALVPLSEWRVDGQGGRVNAWAGGLLVGGSVAPWGDHTITPSLGLGVGALALHTRGEPVSGFRGTSDLNLVAFPHARLGATWTVSQRVRLRAQLEGGFAAPRPVLLFAEERESTWVNPLLSGALGLEVGLD